MNSLKSMVKMEDEVGVIMSIYAKNILSVIDENNHSSIPKINLFYIHRVQEAFNALNEEERELINNDFLDTDSPHWWEPFYTSEQYLKLRYSSVSSFLMHFYD